MNVYICICINIHVISTYLDRYRFSFPSVHRTSPSCVCIHLSLSLMRTHTHTHARRHTEIKELLWVCERKRERVCVCMCVSACVCGSVGVWVSHRAHPRTAFLVSIWNLLFFFGYVFVYVSHRNNGVVVKPIKILLSQSFFLLWLFESRLCLRLCWFARQL